MQLNVHVPREREGLLEELDRAARDLDRTKSQLVLDAVQRYLDELKEEFGRDLDRDVPIHDLGPMLPVNRADLYQERTDAKLKT